MNAAACTIVVEQLADGSYRATCPFLPDCVVVAATPEAARHLVEEAIALHVRGQLETEIAPTADGC